MFGPKGPRSKRPGDRSRIEAPRDRALETVIIQPGGSGAGAASPPRRSGEDSSYGERPRPRRRLSGQAAPARPRLVDLASDWLSTVLALAQVPELPDANALRARALELKARFERGAAEQGFTAADVEDAVYAMVAFLDQTILNGRGPAREAWIGRPLELELYNRQLAGEEFFERLDRLRSERESRIEALEVYAACLAFGFSGKYLLFPERLGPVRDDVERDVGAARGPVSSPLAPNSGRRNERVAEERQGLAWWLAPAGFLAGALLVWLLVWGFARLGAGNAAHALTALTHGPGQ